MKYLLTIILLSYTLLEIKAQDISGKWRGTLTIQGAELPLVFKISKANNGYTTLMDSPAQGAHNIPIEETSFADNRLSISSPKLGIKFAGTFVPDSDKIEGIFNQAKFSLPLKLVRSTEKDESMFIKPQTRF